MEWFLKISIWLLIGGICLFVIAWFLSTFIEVIYEIYRFFYNIYAWFSKKPTLPSFYERHDKIDMVGDDGSLEANNYKEILDKEDLVGRAISFTYESSGDEITHRTVVVESSDKWRFTGKCDLRGDTRTFRFDSIIGDPRCAETGARLEIYDSY